MNAENLLPFLLGVAVLLPLASFFIILVFGPRKDDETGEAFAYISVAAIAGAALCSFAALVVWLGSHWPGSDESVAVHHAPPPGVQVDEIEQPGDSESPGDSEEPESNEPGDDALGESNESEGGEADQTDEDDAPDTEPVHPPGETDDAAHGAPGDDDARGHSDAGGHDSAGHDDAEGHGDGHHQAPKPYYAGEYNVPGTSSPWVLGKFGDLRLSISYYIDALTLVMFCMVTFIATLIQIYAMGYMHEEMHEMTDHEVTLADGSHLKRPGRYHRFFQYLSLFCFSMLGLVVAGNIAMVFVFWELVGICSYFLIGFYVERRSASNAANKAFIVNRVGDFGMIIGLMALWSSLGTFSFGDMEITEGDFSRPIEGIFSKVRPGNQAIAADGMVLMSAGDEARELISRLPANATETEIDEALAENIPLWRAGQGAAGHDIEPTKHGYWLLIVAGLGIFAGCVGKSAQFPLHVWLPDAMEGPTPVSALVHSATMVAAGVYLVGRFFPVFAPEVLLVIALVGCATLFMAASIAITATDIKRVLAYSTVSQLGYMMLALGVGGWLAGMMHLITHAFFKSLLFMCSGSVIHAVHTNEMTEMGGLRKKMPVTAYTMLIGCLAIAGAGVPFIAGFFGGGYLTGVGFSGFYSKDAILEQAFSFMRVNDSAWAGIFFIAATGGAAITSFYMFRLWYLTFAGTPRDQERYDHAHESPPLMYVPLIILAVMAITVAWSPIQGVMGAFVAVIGLAVWRFMLPPSTATNDHGHGETPEPVKKFHFRDIPLVISLVVFLIAVVWFVTPKLNDLVLIELLKQGRPDNTLAESQGVLLDWKWPHEHSPASAPSAATATAAEMTAWSETKATARALVIPVSFMAIGAALTGFLLATFMYGLGWLNPADVRKQFQSVYSFLLNKWMFDELYDWCFVRPTHVVSRLISAFDRSWIDWLVDGLANRVRAFAVFFEWLGDQTLIDGSVNLLAKWTHATGLSLRSLQTGSLRQYVMFIVIGTVAIFLLISFFWNPTLAG
jgi:NADH-quinone oxidoreductase subunit L